MICESIGVTPEGEPVGIVGNIVVSSAAAFGLDGAKAQRLSKLFTTEKQSTTIELPLAEFISATQAVKCSA